MSSSFHNKLKHYVNGVDDVATLHSLLRYIPLQTIKQLIINEIDRLEPSTAKEACLTQLPIDDILPPDAIQHCLSFNRLQHSTKLVSKSWNKHFARNEHNYLRNIYDRDSILNENEANEHRTIVVHPKRVQLHAVESKLGFIGPMTFKDAIQRWQDGDRLLLHAGEYEYPNAHAERTVSHIQLIGVDNVKMYGQPGVVDVVYGRFVKAESIYLENIECVGDFMVRNQKSVFKKCLFSQHEDGMDGIRALKGSVVIVDECCFTGDERAIFVNDEATSMSILNSTFWRYINTSPSTRESGSKGIITILEVMRGPGESMLNFKFVGNKFVNCAALPVVAVFYDVNERSRFNYCLENNVFCTFNDTDGEQESRAYDANTLYRELRDDLTDDDDVMMMMNPPLTKVVSAA